MRKISELGKKRTRLSLTINPEVAVPSVLAVFFAFEYSGLAGLLTVLLITIVTFN